MAQHDQVIDNGSGLAVRTDINAALAALFSSSSGPIEPSTMVAGQPWFDTAIPGQPKYWIRNESNSAWLALLAGAAAEQIVSGNDGTVDFLGFLVDGTQVARVVADPSGAGDLVTYDKTLNGFRDFTLTASGVWTKPADLKHLELRAVGGGGGSAAAAGTNTGFSSAGGGGGGAGVIWALYTDPDVLPATVNYTIGAAGATPGGDGTAGGATIFNLCTAQGGAGGGVMGANGNTFAASGRGSGAGASCTEPASVLRRLYAGASGKQGIRCAHGVTAIAHPGDGGGNMYAPLQRSGYASTVALGVTGNFPGGGASGGGCGSAAAGAAGAFGGAGVIYLREYF